MSCSTPSRNSVFESGVMRGGSLLPTIHTQSNKGFIFYLNYMNRQNNAVLLTLCIMMYDSERREAPAVSNRALNFMSFRLNNRFTCQCDFIPAITN